MISKGWLLKAESSRRIEGNEEGLSRSEGERKVCESDHSEAGWCDNNMDGMWRIETITEEWRSGIRPIVWLEHGTRVGGKRQDEASIPILMHPGTWRWGQCKSALVA